MSILGDRRFVRDYTPIRRANEAALTETSLARPCAYERATIPELVAEVDRIAGHLRRGHVREARFLLTYLNGLPGETWNDRWLLFDDQTQGQPWRNVVMPKRSHLQDLALTAGLGALLMLDVFRPTYSWTLGRKMPVYRALTTFRDPEGAAIFEASLSELGYVRIYMNKVLTTAGQLQSHTGKSIRELEAADLLELLANSERSPQNHRNGLRIVWRLLYDLGWLHHESTVLPDRNRRRGRLTPEQIVDHYEISEPQRSVLVEYLAHRSPALEYNSLRSLASHLVHHFWRDIQDHHPDLKDFVVTRQMMSAYRDRKFGGDQAAAPSTRSDVLFAVRAFYLDVAQWALHDAYWAPWVAATPVTRVDVQAATKERKKVIARTQQRTRVLAPVLPRLIEVADALRRDTAAVLAMAKAAGPGGRIEIDGASWEVIKASPESPLRLHRHGVTRRIEAEEENAFWTWALVETFRHSGLRSEEVLELTHLAIQPYKLPATGETIPLLHIVPSKTNEERMLVASPELVHVLAQIVGRHRAVTGSVPLTQRWDHHAKELSRAAPHLFAKPFGKEVRVISHVAMHNAMIRLAEAAKITVDGQHIRFTPHDFRRIFATDALTSGLPPHIVQVLMGHRSLSTTQGYAAIYPQDVIRHHRTFITQRRQLRPSEEYRQPTAQEWEEFEAHFVRRKVSLGSCGRAYGTNCQHEHACIRCALLRPDPAQMGRLREIISNLHERIIEAQDQGWLGEQEGLKVSLAGAELKLRQMEQQLRSRDEPVALGIPVRRPRHR